MSDTIYVVSYSKGEYSDRNEWLAAWYDTEAEATAHKDAFNAARKRAIKASRSLPSQPWYDDADLVPRRIARAALWHKMQDEWSLFTKLLDQGTLSPDYLDDYNEAYTTPLARGDAALLGVQT